MAHHKRRRPKHRRAGCLICKPHKSERAKRSRQSRAPGRLPGADWRKEVALSA